MSSITAVGRCWHLEIQFIVPPEAYSQLSKWSKEKYIEIRGIVKKIPDGSLLPAICGEKDESALFNAFCKPFGSSLFAK